VYTDRIARISLHEESSMREDLRQPMAVGIRNGLNESPSYGTKSDVVHSTQNECFVRE
jgi:hypothetical protein